MSSFSNSYQNFDDNLLPEKSEQGRSKPSDDPKVILKKVIEKELGKKAPIKDWSEQIETDLIASVVANFERHFPTKSLCKTTLKGLFGRLKEAFANKEAQPFSLDAFLRERLYLIIPDEHKKAPFALSVELAKSLKESWEHSSIAKLSSMELAAPIWSLQKHLLSDIQTPDLRAPFETWDNIDNLVIEQTLATLIEEPLLAHDELASKVDKQIRKASLLTPLNEKKQLKPLIFALYAKMSEEQGLYDLLFTKQQTRSLKRFFSHFTSLGQGAKKELARTEWVERLLSLFILASTIRPNLPEHLVETTIDLCIAQLKGDKVDEKEPHYRDLLIFFNASLYLRCFFASANSYDEIKDFLMETYQLTEALTPLTHTCFSYLEFFIYTQLEKASPLLSQTEENVKAYLLDLIATNMLKQPDLTPDIHIASIMRACNERLQLASEIQGKMAAKLKLKIHMWVSAREMLVRHVCLSCDNPLIREVGAWWKKHVGFKLMQDIDHKAFIETLLTAILDDYPHLKVLSTFVRKTLTTYYLVTWYAMNFSTKASSVDRWLFWHLGVLEGDFVALDQLMRSLLPNIPHEKCMARFKALIKKPKAKRY